MSGSGARVNVCMYVSVVGAGVVLGHVMVRMGSPGARMCDRSSQVLQADTLIPNDRIA